MMRRRGPGLVRGVARTAVVAGTASVVAGRVHHRQEQRWAGQEQQAAMEAQAAAQEQAAMQAQFQAQQQAAAPLAEEAYVAELEQLAQLRNRGILTEEEFQAKKRQILGI